MAKTKKENASIPESTVKFAKQRKKAARKGAVEANEGADALIEEQELSNSEAFSESMSIDEITAAIDAGGGADVGGGERISADDLNKSIQLIVDHVAENPNTPLDVYKKVAVEGQPEKNGIWDAVFAELQRQRDATPDTSATPDTEPKTKTSVEVFGEKMLEADSLDSVIALLDGLDVDSLKDHSGSVDRTVKSLVQGVKGIKNIVEGGDYGLDEIANLEKGVGNVLKTEPDVHKIVFDILRKNVVDKEAADSGTENKEGEKKSIDLADKFDKELEPGRFDGLGTEQIRAQLLDMKDKGEGVVGDDGEVMDIDNLIDDLAVTIHYTRAHPKLKLEVIKRIIKGDHIPEAGGMLDAVFADLEKMRSVEAIGEGSGLDDKLEAAVDDVEGGEETSEKVVEAGDEGGEESEETPEGGEGNVEKGEIVPSSAVDACRERFTERNEEEKSGFNKVKGWFLGRAIGLATIGQSENSQAFRFGRETKKAGVGLEVLYNDLDKLDLRSQLDREAGGDVRSLSEVLESNMLRVESAIDEVVASLDKGLVESKRMLFVIPMGAYRDQFGQKVALIEERVEKMKFDIRKRFADKFKAEYNQYETDEETGELTIEELGDVKFIKGEFKKIIRRNLDQKWWMRHGYGIVEKVADASIGYTLFNAVGGAGNAVAKLFGFGGEAVTSAVGEVGVGAAQEATAAAPEFAARVAAESAGYAEGTEDYAKFVSEFMTGEFAGATAEEIAAQAVEGAKAGFEAFSGITFENGQALTEMHGTVWDTVKDAFIEAGVPNATDTQIQEISERIVLDNYIHVTDWHGVKGLAQSMFYDDSLPEGFKLVVDAFKDIPSYK